MKLADFICFEATVPELQAYERDGVIAELVKSLDEAGKLRKGKCKEVVARVIERENEASTGMGKGVAMPHVKHRAVKSVIAAIGLSAAGVEFFALDKQPVYSVILLISPEAALRVIPTNICRRWRASSSTCKRRSSAGFSECAAAPSRSKSFS
ncbi:MAG: PTS sugar transporter subunit IIA [Planctomycetota bacterium]|jgi:mannitol/fructose-specific phosphotransferase system IIA component (Ntr-type)